MEDTFVDFDLHIDFDLVDIALEQRADRKVVAVLDL